MQFNKNLFLGLPNQQSSVSAYTGANFVEKEDTNLYHGLTPKQFVEELDRQVNLKKLINNANDPLFGKAKKAPAHMTTISSK